MKDSSSRVRSGMLRGPAPLWIAVVVGTAIGLATPAGAHQIPMHSAYPNHGWHWLARNTEAQLWVSSERCHAAEQMAWDRIQNTTDGSASEFRGAWPSGLDLSQARCDGQVTRSIDIVLDYMSESEWFAAGHGNYGGHVHSSIATEAYCSYWGLSHPCGLHPSRIHIRRVRFNNYSGGDTTRRNFLIHESGHSLGFTDYCGVDAVSNYGATNCSLPSGWVSIDRQEMRDHIYPNWRYP